VYIGEAAAEPVKRPVDSEAILDEVARSTAEVCVDAVTEGCDCAAAKGGAPASMLAAVTTRSQKVAGTGPDGAVTKGE
jgi:hypothetical protein